MVLLALWVGTASAGEIRCAELAHMVTIGLPQETVVATLAGDTRAVDEDPACVDSLPTRVREAFAGLPVTGTPVGAGEPGAATAPQPTAPEPATMPIPPTMSVPPTMAVPPTLENRYDRCSDLYLALHAKRPATAVALSASLGLGAGHVYSGDLGGAALFAATEVAGIATMWTSRGSKQPLRQLEIGGAIVLGAHLLDIATAPVPAHAATTRMLMDCGIAGY